MSIQNSPALQKKVDQNVFALVVNGPFCFVADYFLPFFKDYVHFIRITVLCLA